MIIVQLKDFFNIDLACRSSTDCRNCCRGSLDELRGNYGLMNKRKSLLISYNL